MRKRHREDSVGELNLVPYMDIVVNLILFLMVSSTGLVEFGVVNAGAPKLDDTVPTTDAPPSVAVVISEDGFSVAGAMIPKVSGKYDYTSLAKKTAEVKPGADAKLIIEGEPGTSYEAVIGVMDATRAQYPDVLLRPAPPR